MHTQYRVEINNLKVNSEIESSLQKLDLVFTDRKSASSSSSQGCLLKVKIQMNNFALIKMHTIFVYSPLLSICLLGVIFMGAQKKCEKQHSKVSSVGLV